MPMPVRNAHPKLNALQETCEELRKQLAIARNGFSALENHDYSQSTVKVKAICHTHGEFTQFTRQLSLAGFNFRVESQSKCPQCVVEKLAKVEAQIAELAKQQREKKIQSLMENAGISPRFAHASFENFITNDKNQRAKAVCQRYAEQWNNRLKRGGGLVLCGKPGTGKNHLACAIMRQVMAENLAETFITTALRLVRKVKSTWNKQSNLTEDEALAFYASKDLLVIDEIGVQFGSEAEKLILFELINERYEQMRPTILISNLTQAELGNYIGDRVLDRMREGEGVLVNFDWESYRK